MSAHDLYDVANLVCIYGIFAVSLNLLLGWSGIPAVAPTAFGAVGGYAAGFIALNYDVPLLPTLLISTAAAALLGFLIALPSLRLSIENVILLTLALGTIVLSTAIAVPGLGGPQGLVQVPYASMLGVELRTASDWVPVLGLALLLTYLVVRWLGNSPLGLTLKGAREDESAVRSLGINPVPAKVAAFTISSGFAGLAGALLVFYNNVASPNSFGFNQGILIVTMIIVGGLGRPVGPVVGALVVVLLPKLLQVAVDVSSTKAALYQQIIYGVILIAVMLFRPSGLTPEKPLSRVTKFVRARLARADDVTAEFATESSLAVAVPTSPTPEDEPAPVLRAHHLSKSFGGLRVANALDFSLPAGQVIGLVGPNGAGKTTLFNLLTGAIRADRGSVELLGQDVSRHSMDRIARAGMARSFQDVRFFDSLTLMENVLLGALPAETTRLRSIVFAPRRTRRRVDEAIAASWRVLESLDLQQQGLTKGSALSYGERKVGAMARIIATSAPVLLLDEPAAGVGAELAQKILRIVAGLRDKGHTILLIEHNLEVVRDIATSVFFMESGAIRAHGRYEDLIADPLLATLYFGSGHTSSSSGDAPGHVPARHPSTSNPVGGEA